MPDSVQVQGKSGPITAPDLMAQLLSDHSSTVPIARAVAALIMAAVRGSEDTKCAIMDSKVPERVLAVAGAAAERPDAPPIDVSVGLLTAICAAITADDARPPASKAFMNARVCPVLLTHCVLECRIPTGHDFSMPCLNSSWQYSQNCIILPEKRPPRCL